MLPYARRQAPDRGEAEHREVCKWVLDELIGTSSQREFTVEYGDWNGEYVRRSFGFQLLAERQAPDGSVYLRATDAAINVLVGALDTDVESAQAAAEAKLENLVRRGRLSEAQYAAQLARYRTIQLGERIRQDLAATKRNLATVDWTGDVSPRLDGALAHIGERLEVERRIVDNIRETRDRAEESEKRAQAASLIELLDECQSRSGGDPRPVSSGIVMKWAALVLQAFRSWMYSLLGMVDREQHEIAMHVLQAAGVAQAANELLPIDELAKTHAVSPTGLRLEIEKLEQMGLMLSGLEEGNNPILLNAGRQYLDRRGDVPTEVLRFLPRVVDDLTAREVLIHAGTVLVDTFRADLLDGAGVDRARDLVPPAFTQAVDESLALNLFSAAVALVVRLSEGRPAGCVAEEIVAVRLIEEAEAYLDMHAETHNLSMSEVKSATAEFRGIFELFEDDDVLDLFEMSEPSDAAVAGGDPLKREMGVVDQRIEAWFEPFGWTTPTGYIGK